ncbi:MAG TPA: nucleotidyltransferase domain-containing protein [Bacteroidales bacterium]|nr:nucleotidyltransferase domain-containing protein [Bacteroidales bacterium]
MILLSEKLKELRFQSGEPLRKVAAFLDIDQAILSKIENGKRKVSRDQVVKLAEYYGIDSDTLLILWLTDKITYELRGEHLANAAMKVAEERLRYIPASNVSIEFIKNKIKEYFSGQNNVLKAWLFGSYARGDHDSASDIDIMIQIRKDKSFSLFDLAEIQYQLGRLISGRIDVVMKDAVSPEVMNRINPELILIYER